MKLFLVVLSVLFLQINARVVKWTAAGGTESWDFARNWDCQCIPTSADDVVIDVPNIAGSVRIGGNPAQCNSLTVGGSSQFIQQLYISGPLSIGSGGGKISTNGLIYLDGAPDSPINNAGNFDANNRFIFQSGGLAGTGSFSFSTVNFTGPALKALNTSVSVSETLFVQPGAGAQGVIQVGTRGKVKISGVISTTETLTLAVDNGGSLQIPGSVVFGGAPGKKVTFRGYSFVASLNANGGSVEINDAIDFGTLSLASGSSLELIGSPDAARTFGSVGGSGTVNCRGGTNTFKGLNVAAFNLISCTFLTNSSLSVGSLVVTGGNLKGKGNITATSTKLVNGNFDSIFVGTNNLELAGFTQLVGAKFQLTGTGSVTASSQFTMTSGSAFSLTSTARLGQGNSMKLLQSGQDQPPLFTNDGAWVSTSDLTIAVNTKGNGSWQLGKGSQVTLTGISFNAGSVDLTSASLLAQAAVIDIDSVSGPNGGVFDVNGNTVTVNNLEISVYRQQIGATQFSTGTVGTLTVKGGTVTVNQGGSIYNLDFQAGTIIGGGSGVILNSSNTTLTTKEPKRLQSVSVYSSAISYKCPNDSCQLFADHAVLATPPK
eukprot:TRINITY_DN359_c0_g1_i1.p1 TRINITY_DN359_c0_g1~~TRINITY_DN359_c0_g1_i1.p1  ORF type:complete len:601 (+),score=195.14 TRINITY_DN359_c0_g1_i1:1760-3562(+)